MRWLACVATACVASVCAGCGAQTAVGAGGAGDELPIERCEDLERAQRAPVIGPLSESSETAAWQQGRAEYGIPSAIASTIGANASPDAVRSFGFPMTRDEDREVSERLTRAESMAESVRALLKPRRDFTDAWPESAVERVHVSTTGDVAALQAELDIRFGTARTSVVSAPLNRVGFEQLADRVADYRDPSGGPLLGSGWTVVGRVAVTFSILDPVLVAAFAESFPADLNAVCVAGTDPADVVPDGPQPERGEGWRLLADEVSGDPYATGFAADPPLYEALWFKIGLEEAPPVVDFDHELVVWFGAAIGSSCNDIRLDDVVFDPHEATLSPRIVLPGGGRACTADLAGGHAYVVALERSRLPSKFTITLGRDMPDACCSAARTTVDLGAR